MMESFKGQSAQAIISSEMSLWWSDLAADRWEVCYFFIFLFFFCEGIQTLQQAAREVEGTLLSEMHKTCSIKATVTWSNFRPVIVLFRGLTTWPPKLSSSPSNSIIISIKNELCFTWQSHLEVHTHKLHLCLEYFIRNTLDAGKD